MQDELHEIQASILKELLFNNGSNFAALNTNNLDNNHFTFHIKRLVSQDFIEKIDNQYFLTVKGKQYAGKMDVESLKLEKYGKITVSIACIRIVEGKKQFLMQQRQKEPFFGWWGNISGKVRFGETTKDAALRELKEETGLSGTPKFMGIMHTIRGDSEKDTTLDNYFVRYLFKNPTGDLIDTREGKNVWMDPAEIKKLNNKFQGFDQYLENMLNENEISYTEEFYLLEDL